MQPWKKRLGGESRAFAQKRKMFMRENHSTGGRSGQKLMHKSTPPKKWPKEKQVQKPRNL